MVLNYKNVNGYQEEQPLAFDTVSSPGNIYLRKNIKKVSATEEEPECWNYDEVMLNSTEYQEYLNDIQSVSIQTIMQKLEAISLQIDEK